MGFAQTDFPGQCRVFDGSERGRAGAAVVAANGDDVCTGLSNPGCDDADACAGHELYADASTRIDRAEIMDELREVFDAVNVVMRRRRNQRRAGRGMANARHVWSDFSRGELAAFARLGTLGHLDFKFLRVHKVVRSNTETAGS